MAQSAVAGNARLALIGGGDFLRRQLDSNTPSQLSDAVTAFARDLRLEECAAVWLRTENDPVYAPEHLAELGVFTSVLTLTLRVVR